MWILASTLKFNLEMICLLGLECFKLGIDQCQGRALNFICFQKVPKDILSHDFYLCGNKDSDLYKDTIFM